MFHAGMQSQRSPKRLLEPESYANNTQLLLNLSKDPRDYFKTLSHNINLLKHTDDGNKALDESRGFSYTICIPP